MVRHGSNAGGDDALDAGVGISGPMIRV